MQFTVWLNFNSVEAQMMLCFHDLVLVLCQELLRDQREDYHVMGLTQASCFYFIPQSQQNKFLKGSSYPFSVSQEIVHFQSH